MITSTTHTVNNRTITVAEGSNVTLRCEATVNGTLNYQWKRVSGSLPSNVNGSNEQNLTIYSIAINNSGEYFCQVDNGSKRESSKNVQVTPRSESL